MPESLGPFNLILLSMPGVALLATVRLLYGRRLLSASDPLHLLLSMSGWVLILLAAVGVVAGMMGPFSIGLLVAAIVVSVMATNVYRRNEHRALLWTLALSSERGVPLAEAAVAYADENAGDTGVRALVLADYLRLGWPLDQAVRMAKLRMSTATRLALRLGTALGQFGPALRQQMQDGQQVESLLQGMLGRLYYLALLLVVGNGVVTFVMLKIVPVFDKMFDEFGLRLPHATRTLINVSRTLVDGPLAMITILALPALSFLLVVLTLFYVGWLPRDLPLLVRLFRRYDGALILRALALVVRQGRPMTDVFLLLAEHYPLRSVAWKLKVVAARVAQGGDWCLALYEQGFFTRRDMALLQSAQRAGNLPWALEELAESMLRRQVIRLQAWYNTLFPFVLFLFGTIVGWFVIALFMPLVALIQGLT